MRCCTVFVLLLLGAVQAVCAQVPAPVWHTGQSWRVQVPWVLVSHPGRGDRKDTGPTDSTTKFDTYRFKVLGQRKLRFEEQDGNYHIGQAVPSESCWLVNIAPEGNPAPSESYHCYFRVSDLSLREIYRPGLNGGQGRYFPYSSTRVRHENEDGTPPFVEASREPYRDSVGTLLLDWPRFPLAAGTSSSVEQVSQTVTPEGAGMRVVLRDDTESTMQIWMPGEPWWRSAERDGRQKSRLLPQKQTGQPVIHQVK